MIALSSNSGRANDKSKCKIQDFFKFEGFSIEFSLVDSFVDYLDVRLHSNQTHESYHKPNSDKVYVHKLSNHPPSVLKNIQANTELRLSKLNSNEKLFKNNAEFYSKVLAKSGHNSALIYQKDLAQNKKSKKRKRPNNRITWYNPPWNCDLKTNLGRKFQNLISPHFIDDLAWLNSRTRMFKRVSWIFRSTKSRIWYVRIRHQTLSSTVSKFKSKPRYFQNIAFFLNFYELF